MSNNRIRINDKKGIEAMVQHAGELFADFRKKRGWKQWELALYLGLKLKDSSVISKIENGERPLSKYYMHRLENSGSFSNDEVVRLKEQAAVDRIRAEYGIDISQQLRAPLDGLEEILTEITKLRMTGNTETINLLHKPIVRLRKYRSQYANDMARINRLLAKFLKERLENLTETSSMYNIVSITRNDLGELRSLHDALREDDLEDYEYVNAIPAGIRFTAGDNEHAIRLAKRLINSLTTSYAISKSLHTLILAPAVLVAKGESKSKQIEQFLEFESQAQKAISDGRVNLNGKSMLLEGIAGARVHLGLSDWQIPLDDAKKVQQLSMHRGAGRATIMGSIARTEILNLIRENESSWEDIIEKCEQAMPAFEKSGYLAYQDQVISELIKTQNTRLQDFGKHLRNVK